MGLLRSKRSTRLTLLPGKGLEGVGGVSLRTVALACLPSFLREWKPSMARQRQPGVGVRLGGAPPRFIFTPTHHEWVDVLPFFSLLSVGVGAGRGDLSPRDRRFKFLGIKEKSSLEHMQSALFHPPVLAPPWWRTQRFPCLLYPRNNHMR